MKKVLVSIAAAAAISGMAMAGGDIAPVAPAPVDNWSGFYVGAQLGGVWGDADVERSSDTAVLDRVNGLDVDGWNGGLYAGYNWLLDNNFVLGIEGDWTYIDADDSGSIGTQGTAKVEQKWDASLRLRAGYAMDNIMPYITGGIAWSSIKTTFDNGINATYSNTDTYTGWTLGAGIEYAISENLHVRLQYRYTDYGDETFTFINHANQTRHIKTDYNAHMVQVGFSYRF
ncbi:outer membrane protein [Nitratifractor sp.]